MAGETQDRSRRRAAAAGASLLLHAAALSWLGLRIAPDLPTASPPEPPPLTVELLREAPSPATRAAAAPAPRPTPARPRALAPTSVPAVAVAPRPRQPRPTPPQVLTPPPLPIPPVPSPGRSPGAGVASPPAAGPPAAPLARTAPGPLPGAEGAADLRGLLRATVGCSHDVYMKLSPAERARCDQGFAAARDAPRILPADDKLAAFARQADANARHLRTREGGLPNTLPPCDPSMVGANLVGSCLPPEAMHTVKKF